MEKRTPTPNEQPVELVASIMTNSDDNSDDNGDNHLPLVPSLKKWKRIAIYCLGLTAGILMYGYDHVVVGTTAAMPSFQ
jgi:hypothetical protein